MSAKLLLIEDDSEISELLSTLLSQEGFSVNTAFDGARGEKLALV
jgi:DNA-binding response OmpR family regulator